MTPSRRQSNPAVTPCSSAMADTRAGLRPSTRPRARSSPSDAAKRGFCRSFSRPSSCHPWRSRPSASNQRCEPCVRPRTLIRIQLDRTAQHCHRAPRCASPINDGPDSRSGAVSGHQLQRPRSCPDRCPALRVVDGGRARRFVSPVIAAEAGRPAAPDRGCSSTSPGRSRPKPSVRYPRCAATICSAVCSVRISFPARRATWPPASTSCRPTPRPRAPGSTATSRRLAWPGGRPDPADRRVKLHDARADDAPAGHRDQHGGESGPAGHIGQHAEVGLPQRVARPGVLGVRALTQAAGVLVPLRTDFPDLDLTQRPTRLRAHEASCT